MFAIPPLVCLILPTHSFSLFFFNDTATTEIYTLSLHDALPISLLESPSRHRSRMVSKGESRGQSSQRQRSEEHTSELQSRLHLVCRLLLEKKKKSPTLRLLTGQLDLVAIACAR